MLSAIGYTIAPSLRPAGATPGNPETGRSAQPERPQRLVREAGAPARTGAPGPVQPLIDATTLTSLQEVDPKNANKNASRSAAESENESESRAEDSTEAGTESGTEPGAANAAESPTDPRSAGLSDQEKSEVKDLKSEDARVRAHEQAHAAAGGANAGSPQFVFTNGPDGRRYATSGSVPIDISPEQDPAATISKMEVVKRAALAPTDPSAADRSIAAQADKQKATAQSQAREETAAATDQPAADPASRSANIEATSVEAASVQGSSSGSGAGENRNDGQYGDETGVETGVPGRGDFTQAVEAYRRSADAMGAAAGIASLR